MDHVYKLRGMPESIISDKGSIFLSQFWHELFKLLGIKLKFSTSYHLQIDGQTERVNACLETYFRYMAGHKPKAWHQWLSLAEWWFNTHYHSRMKMSPFQALYGYQPLFQGHVEPSATQVASVEDYLLQRKPMLQLVKEGLKQAQERMKVIADKKRTERTLKVGDWVYLRLQPYRQSTVAIRRNMKLAAKYYGPFQVLACVGKVVYKLNLPAHSKIHPMFHVSQLKKKLSKKKVPIQQLFYADESGQMRVEPMAILDRRMIKRNNVAVEQVLVQWTNVPPENATWEDTSFIAAQFPAFNP